MTKNDLISRADAIEALCHNCAYYTDAQCKTDSGYWCESGAMIREEIPSAETHEIRTETHGVCSDLISREEVLRTIITAGEVEPNLGYTHLHDVIASLPSADAEPKENHTQTTGAKHVIKSLGTDSISHNGIDCTEFIHWLIEEVMDDEMWELNAVGNGEIICRKLKKLGLLEVKDGYYVRTPLAEAVQGEWIFENTDEHKRTYCSVCGASAPFECVSDDYYGRRVHGETRKTKFCPNCGTRMVKQND